MAGAKDIGRLVKHFGIPDAPPTLIRPEPTGHRVPTGGRVIATPVLNGLHHEYRLIRDAA